MNRFLLPDWDSLAIRRITTALNINREPVADNQDDYLAICRLFLTDPGESLPAGRVRHDWDSTVFGLNSEKMEEMPQ
jgi:hypothetical protein